MSKQIYINAYNRVFYPCEIISFKHVTLTNNYIIHFFDLVIGDYKYAYVKKKGNKFYLDEIVDCRDTNLLHTIANAAHPDADITLLPHVLDTYASKRDRKNSSFIDINKSPEAFVIKRKADYLELVSYGNALLGKQYLYFKIKNVKLFKHGFGYQCEFVESSFEPIKNKNIIAKHETGKSLNDLYCENGEYLYIYDKREKEFYDPINEKTLIKKIINENNGKRMNLDSELLTKTVRIILQEENRLEAFINYERYLETFYDKWDKDKKRNK